MSERINGALQENLLSLICFSPSAASLIRNSVEPGLFSSPLFRETVSRAYDFLDQHKEPPGEHLPDLLEDILVRKDSEAELAERLVNSVISLKGKVNESYVLSQLEAFVRRQRITSSLIKASSLVQEGNIDGAALELEEGLRSRLQLFAPGTTLSQGWRKALSREVRIDVIPTGIKPLDDWELGPARGELHLFLGPPKRAKTWWLVNLGKRALLARLRVCYISLELSELQIIQRFVQSLFSIGQRHAEIEVSRLKSDELGRFVSFERDKFFRKAFGDKKLPAELERLIDQFHMRDNLLVKNFPTRSLTMQGLRAYLDALERAHHFIPDVLIVDYPDLMHVDSKYLRVELGALFQDVRGLAVERNIIMPTVSQANRAGAEAKLMTDTHASEDWSKIFTADTVLTYSQTMAEKELGLARIFVSNTRVSERDRFVVLISQAYQIGQFCLDATLMTDNYWKRLTEATGKEGEADGSA